MGVDWDNIRGETKRGKARALVVQAERTGQTPQLKSIIRLARPNLRSQLT
jgi:hypothetical protein